MTLEQDIAGEQSAQGKRADDEVSSAEIVFRTLTDIGDKLARMNTAALLARGRIEDVVGSETKYANATVRRMAVAARGANIYNDAALDHLREIMDAAEKTKSVARQSAIYQNQTRIIHDRKVRDLRAENNRLRAENNRLRAENNRLRVNWTCAVESTARGESRLRKARQVSNGWRLAFILLTAANLTWLAGVVMQ